MRWREEEKERKMFFLLIFIFDVLATSKITLTYVCLVGLSVNDWGIIELGFIKLSVLLKKKIVQGVNGTLEKTSVLYWNFVQQTNH